MTGQLLHITSGEGYAQRTSICCRSHLIARGAAFDTQSSRAAVPAMAAFIMLLSMQLSA
jgi:hypothetical protein